MRAIRGIGMLLAALNLLLGGTLFILRQTPAPNGWIYFMTYQNEQADIYRVLPNGRNLRPVVLHPSDDLYPAISPDGEWMVFSSLRDGNGEIYKLSLVTGHTERLTDDPANDIFPRWSSDGQQVYFITRRVVTYDLFVMAADGSHPTRFSNTEVHAMPPAPSPDGDWVAYGAGRTGSSDIYRMHTQTRRTQQLTEQRFTEGYPIWSPDGKWLVIEYLDGRQTDIALLNPAIPNDLTPIAASPADEYQPAWSPDGEYIVFTANRGNNPRDFNLYTVHVASGAVTQITDLPDSEFLPAWGNLSELAWRGIPLTVGIILLMVGIFGRRAIQFIRIRSGRSYKDHPFTRPRHFPNML